jgi:hypothetical protein
VSEVISKAAAAAPAAASNGSVHLLGVASNIRPSALVAFTSGGARNEGGRERDGGREREREIRNSFSLFFCDIYGGNNFCVMSLQVFTN